MADLYQMDEVDHFGKPVPELRTSSVIETDYRLFRYSKFALPWLVFMLLFGIVLFCLTIWQGGYAALKTIKAGVPRDMEPWAKDYKGDGGLSRQVRNLRFAVASTALAAVLFILVIYYSNPRPKTQRILYVLCTLIIAASVVLAVIAFAIDVTKTDECVKCKTEFGTRTRYCESRAAYAVVVTACDAAVAVFGLVCICMILAFSGDDTFKNTHGTWTEEGRDMAYENPLSPEELGMQPIVPGMDVVHKTLVFLGLAALFIAAVLLLLFTIFIHEFRERVVGNQWDPLSGQQQSGWPRENSRFRMSVTIILMLLCLLSFVPYPKRVFVYALFFFFAADCAMFFVIFAMDVKDLQSARNLPCPTGVTCIYHPYNTVCVFDFLCGVWIVIYLLYEGLFKHGQSTVTSQREMPQTPLAEFVPTAYDPAYAIKGPGQALEGPAMRPLLGVEVIEVESATGELNVTVMNVTPGGAAEEAGLRPGDVIAHWDEIPIHCKRDFAQAVANARIGSTVVLQVVRQSRIGPAASTTSVAYCKMVVRGVAA